MNKKQKISVVINTYNAERHFQLRFFVREGTVWPPYVHIFPIAELTERVPIQYQMLHLADESMRQWAMYQ